MDYWFECISAVFDDEGITATIEQTRNVAEAVEGVHGEYSTAHGYDVAQSPLDDGRDRKIKRLEADVELLRRAVETFSGADSAHIERRGAGKDVVIVGNDPE